MYVCDYRRGMDWILDLLTQHATTINYSAIADLHKSQITRAPAKPFFPGCCVFNSRSLATASNSEDSSASRVHVVTVRQISRK
jgi:hypothetical protein